MAGILTAISRWMAPKLVYISLVLVATVLAIFGSDINRRVRKLLRGSHFVVRFGVFVFLCAFGYGMATMFAATLLRRLLLRLGPVWLAPVVVLCFVVMGFLAERKNHL